MVFMSALLSFKSLTLFPNECTSSCNSETRSLLLSINTKRSFSSRAPAAAHLAAAVNHWGFCKSLIPT